MAQLDEFLRRCDLNFNDHKQLLEAMQRVEVSDKQHWLFTDAEM
jgi:hypothetical protein